jgi:DNA polymerase/3'-5' exonuclease PolX
MNTILINEFSKLLNYYETCNEKNSTFKIKSTKKTLRLIKSLKFEVTNFEQLEGIPGIGAKTLDKINDILKNGKLDLPETEHIMNKSSITSKNTDKTKIKNLMRISGIGPKKAQALIKEKVLFETLVDALKRDDKDYLENYLTHHQIIGLKYLEDIEKRISFDEIKIIETYLKKVFNHFDPKMTLYLCGSYRRKAKTSGDIDIIVSKDKFSKNILCSVIDFLKEQNFLVDDLTYNGNTKYMGICKNRKGQAIRIDIRYIKKENIPSALLYFTGSGEFNKNMRTYAIKHNFKLNEYGLFKKSGDEFHPVKNIKSEKDIFRELGIVYIPPEKRTEFINFNDLKNKLL